MDALNFGLQRLTTQPATARRFIPKDELLAKIQSCVARIPSNPPSVSLTLENLRAISSEQVILTFHQICKHGNRTEALGYLESYQQLFKGYAQFQSAYFLIARDCLYQGYIADAIRIAGSDKEKQAILDSMFDSANLELLEKMAEFARSLLNEKCKRDYLLYCAAHQIHQGAFAEASALLEENSKPFESQYRDLFALCPDWNRLHAFAHSLKDNALRQRCLQICRDYNSSDSLTNTNGKRSRICLGSGLQRARLE